MKKKLEVKIERDGRKVTAQCLHLDDEYRGKGVLINDGEYFIESAAEIEISDYYYTLYVWGVNKSEDDSVSENFFDTEQEAIEYVENITKLIDEFNGEQISQDEIDEILKPYNAKIIQPCKTVKIKSVDGVEFEVYEDELRGEINEYRIKQRRY